MVVDEVRLCNVRRATGQMSTVESKGGQRPKPRYQGGGLPHTQWVEPLRRPELKTHYSFEPGERQMARRPKTSFSHSSPAHNNLGMLARKWAAAFVVPGFAVQILPRSCVGCKPPRTPASIPRISAMKGAAALKQLRWVSDNPNWRRTQSHLLRLCAATHDHRARGDFSAASQTGRG